MAHLFYAARAWIVVELISVTSFGSVEMYNCVSETLFSSLYTALASYFIESGFSAVVWPTAQLKLLQDIISSFQIISSLQEHLLLACRWKMVYYVPWVTIAQNWAWTILILLPWILSITNKAYLAQKADIISWSTPYHVLWPITAKEAFSGNVDYK